MSEKSIQDESQEWWDYPKCLEDYNPVVVDGDAITRRMKELASDLFTDEDSVDVQIIERYESSQKTSVLTFFDEDTLIFFVKADSRSSVTPNCRIISIPQAFSLSELSINQNCMQQLLAHFNVSLDFLNVLFKFGNQSHVFEESSGYTSVSLEPDGSYNMSYQLMYVEKNGRKPPKDPWSMRQTGVFHQYSSSNNTSLFIFLHPMKNSVAQRRLEALFEKGDRAGALSQEAMDIHVLLFSSYLNNWQVYIEELARIFKSLREKILAFDVSRDVNYNLSPDTLKELRNLEDKVSFRTSACLRGAIRTVGALKTLYEAHTVDGFTRDSGSKKMYSSLSAMLNRLEGHLASVEIMQKRIGATIGLLANLLDLRNQSASDKLNNHMLALTQETVDDNATVRVITVFSLIYLPASFVASLLGTNLFSFQTSSRRFVISTQFWIYVCVTIPLTVITLSTWWLMKSQQDKKRRQRRTQGKKVEP